jgi:hypothetical protein
MFRFTLKNMFLLYMSTTTTTTTLASATISVVNVLSDILNGKYAIEITSQESAFIKMVIEQNPNVFSNISSQINDLLVSKKITILDLPKVINIISTIYSNHLIIGSKDLNIDIINIVQITVMGLLYANILNLPNEINTELENYVSELITLLRTNISFVEATEKKCFSFFRNLCCKKTK